MARGRLALGVLVVFIRPISRPGADDPALSADPSPTGHTGTCPLQQSPPGGSAAATSVERRPAGWQVHADTTGFCIAVPAGWKVRTDATHTFFGDPSGTRTLEVSWSTEVTLDPLADFQGKISLGRLPKEVQGCTGRKQQAYAIVWYTDDSSAGADRVELGSVLGTFVGAG